ncbi:MAG: tRNA pseudouridine(55) synthase TruB [Gammaproteobacteria bacterium]|nr:tRNA pseudouridine(55) synthase TruB [Gammaproteobacteria bacterium]
MTEPSGHRAPVDGILLLDKAHGMTSNAALQAAKRLLQARKAGHAGTLDPMATGLLPVLFGEATKLAFLLADADKSYVADVVLGVTTTTGDAEGEVRESRAVEVRSSDIEAALRRFRGEIEQLPPMYSALKHAGRPLYAYARAGQQVERRPRRVRVHGLELIERTAARLRIGIRCSKGTYVRTLAEDLGRALGTGAHLGALRRVASGSWRIEQAVPLDRLPALSLPERRGLLMPPSAVLDDLPRVTLRAEDEVRFCNGQSRRLPGLAAGLYGVFASGERLLGIGEIASDGALRPRRLLHAPQSAQPAE